MASTTTTQTPVTVSYNNIPALSYNTTGWSTVKADFINTILVSHGILVCALQEHFQLRNNTPKIDCFNNFEVFSVPAYKNNNVVHTGRPSGGLSLIYNNTLSKYATRLLCPGSHRVQGLKLNLPSAPLLFINCYFPTDPGHNNFDENDLLCTLQDIKYLIDAGGENCILVLMGDLNTDFSRDSMFAQIVKTFLLEINVASVWSSYDCDFTYYHERIVGGRTVKSSSIIDHFCLNTEHFNMCTEAAPLHFGDNHSNHEPIFLRLDCAFLSQNIPSSDDSVNKSNRPQWHKATGVQTSNYKGDLHAYLNDIEIDVDVLACRNPHCTSESHCQGIDDMCHNVMEAVTKAVEKNIPTNASGSSAVIPGWNDHIQSYKDKSIFWYSIWTSAGKPLDNELHKVMKWSRNQYKYQIRRVKRQENAIRNSKFLSACLDGKVSDILLDIKKSRGTNSKPSTSIDGVSGCREIADHFKNMYKTIYNTHNDKDDLNTFCTENNEKISQSDIDVVDSITPDMVKKGILSFKNNKNDSLVNWKSDALKIGVDSLADPLCDLLRAMLIHGHIPSMFLICSLIPIVKSNNASKSSSANYRLIAISSLVLKLFDFILLEISSPYLKPSALQFGFQKGLSTGLCTWSLTETINFFRNRGSPIHLCLMDLTKAFDLVKLSVLFNKLSGHVPPILLRLIICSYREQNCHVRWSDVQSGNFQISNGVRQGAVASPTLFNWYINSLFEDLSSSGYGCNIDGVFFGAWAYADDIGLISPSKEALQLMVNLCKDFFDRHGIQISTNADVKKTKTKVLSFGVTGQHSPILLGDSPLPFVKEWVHLGHVISTDESTCPDMLLKKRELNGKIHGLKQEFGSLEPTVFIKLVRIFLLHLYGCTLWDLFSEETNKLWSTWHRLLKTSFKLSPRTHKYLTNNLVEGPHIKKLVIQRFVKFSKTITSSSSVEMKLLHSYQCRDWRSTYGRNYCNILRAAGVQDIASVDINLIPINPIPVGEEWRVALLKDLLDTRNDGDGFISASETDDLMNFVCYS